MICRMRKNKTTKKCALCSFSPTEKKIKYKKKRFAAALCELIKISVRRRVLQIHFFTYFKSSWFVRLFFLPSSPILYAWFLLKYFSAWYILCCVESVSPNELVAGDVASTAARNGWMREIFESRNLRCDGAATTNVHIKHIELQRKRESRKTSYIYFLLCNEIGMENWIKTKYIIV